MFLQLLILSYSLHGIYSFSSSIQTTSSSTNKIIPKEILEPIFIERELTPIERLQRAVSFYSAALPIFISYKSLDYQLKLRRELLNEIITEKDEESLFNVLHDWGSDIIADKIKELKGFYVKTGQVISTRVDIFPLQYTSKLAMTQDKLDPISADIIKNVLSSIHYIIYNYNISYLLITSDN